ARHLNQQGYKLELYFIGTEAGFKSNESRLNWNILQNLGVHNPYLNIFKIHDSSQIETTNADVIVDAMMGTGVSGKLREPIATAVEVINGSDAVVVAVDIPTGMDPLTGSVYDRAVMANHTVTFHKPKTGLLNADTKYVGDLTVCDIGIPMEAELFTGPGDILRLNKREMNSHKGQNGRVLVLGGSENYSGAPALAALSALRSGVDIAVIACPNIVSGSIRSYSPDLIVRALSEDYVRFEDSSDILEISDNADSVVVGCGIRIKDETGLVINEMVEKIQKPIVLDAVSLKIVDKNVVKGSDKKLVLTPHKAEFKAFFDLDIPEDLNDKIKAVESTAAEFGCTILLKGVVDIISDGNRTKLNSSGNPGMSVGGTGDVLAGLVAGLISKGHDAFEAAFLGAYINGVAGDFAKNSYGYNFLATDVIDQISNVFMEK
ncbi:MAG: NAD(P)H-hydrate dehydratase, partial [Methanobacterium sp.]|nr:NAD(P)H-hydrate dehydratase [Methanobacterium sp.]